MYHRPVSCKTIFAWRAKTNLFKFNQYTPYNEKLSLRINLIRHYGSILLWPLCSLLLATLVPLQTPLSIEWIILINKSLLTCVVSPEEAMSFFIFSTSCLTAATLSSHSSFWDMTSALQWVLQRHTSTQTWKMIEYVCFSYLCGTQRSAYMS